MWFEKFIPKFPRVKAQEEEEELVDPQQVLRVSHNPIFFSVFSSNFSFTRTNATKVNIAKNCKKNTKPVMTESIPGQKRLKFAVRSFSIGSMLLIIV